LVAADLRDRVAVDVRVAMVGRLPGQHIRTMRHTPCRLIMRSAHFRTDPGRQMPTWHGDRFHIPRKSPVDVTA
jgi:hypothetical protein